MSYIEHGPRIFLAGRPTNNIPLTYGDYVAPKKRLEGRLKVYDSCSDIRAWSPNPLESSQYFRELTENAAPPGKIIPFNVVIENIISLTSQAQNELQVLRQELKKYKSLKLTTEQEKYLQNFEDKIIPNYQKEKEHKDTIVTQQSLREGSRIINKSTSLPHLDSYLAIQINPEHFSYNGKYYQNSSLFGHLDSVSCKDTYLVPKLRSIYVSSQIESAKNDKYKDAKPYLTNLENKYTQVEYTDTYAQIKNPEVGTQTDGLIEYTSSTETKVSSIRIGSQTSSCKYNDEIRKRDLSIESYTENESESSSISESDFDIDIHDGSHKDIIIQKDSEIIALKNELGAKEAEVEELKEASRNLEIMLEKKDENLNTLQKTAKIFKERLIKLNDERNNKLEDMEKKLHVNTRLMNQLKMEFNKNLEVCVLQSKELDELRLHVKEVAALRKERDSLMEKVKEMERLSKEAENCRDALDQLKRALREKDELRKRSEEQDCKVADQDDEIKRLMALIKQLLSTENDHKHRMATVIEELQAKIIDKDNTVSKYEEQLRCMEQEINDFTIKLKNNVNNIEEFKIAYEDTCSRAKCDHDICERTKRTLCAVGALMEELHKSKIRGQESLQQIGHFKNYTKESMSASHLNYNSSSSSISEVNELNTIMVRKIQTSQQNLVENTPFDYIENGVINNKMMPEYKTMYEYIDVEDHSNRAASEPDSWNSAKTELSILAANDNVNIESAIVEVASQLIIKVKSLMEQLEIYAEKEKPSLNKQNHCLYKDLTDSKSVIVWSPDATITKQEIYELHNTDEEQCQKHKLYIKTSNKDLQGPSITEEFVKTLLRWQLEKVFRHDIDIDKVFSTQIKHSIEKMNELSMALQGAGDQCIQVVKEVEKKQQEILEKDTEIARLKEQVQMGEGDCIRLGKAEQDIIKNNFRTLEIEVKQKDQLMLECNELKQENKSLIDAKNMLIKECNTKNNELKEKHDEINRLVKLIKDDMEKAITDLTKKLNVLQEENSELMKKLEVATEIISKKNGLIGDLKDEQEKDKHIFELKQLECDRLLTERQNLINNLQNENSLINKKLIDTENKIVLLDKTISSLSKQNDEMKLLDILHSDTSRIEKDIKKLEMKSSKCKLELLNYENINKESERRLAAFIRENEIIKEDIEMLKDKLSAEQVQEFVTNDELKQKLNCLPNELYNKIMNLKNQTCQRETNSLYLMHNLHKDMDKDFEDEKYKSKQIENENTKEQLSKIQDLIYEVENKDLEIEKLKKRVNYLTEENDDLYNKIKYHAENYEDKLTILKKRYDSSISALHKKHRENIEHLKITFGEINGERIIFDSESWLQSLSIKELADVYNRIFLLMNKLNINNDNKAILNLSDKEELRGAIHNFVNKCENDQKEDVLMDMQHNKIKLREDERDMIRMRRVKLKDHRDSSKKLMEKHYLQDKNKKKSKETNIFQNIAWEKNMFFDPMKKTKYDSNSRTYNNKMYANKDMPIPTAKTMKANTVSSTNVADLQRENFIYQCSVHLKESNIF